MATFRYIGTMVKANGRVDVRCKDSTGTPMEWNDVEPNVTVIDVGNDNHVILSFENAVDIFNNFTYQRIT